MSTENQCPCCSGSSYQECCQPFHEGKLPDNALKLMRSRFAAYSLNLPDYLIATTHPASPQYSPNTKAWAQNIDQFSTQTSFDNLEILGFIEQGRFAIVTFTAHLSQNQKNVTFTEKSYFEKIHGRWFYRNGQLAEGRDTNLIPLQSTNILPLAYYGEPILRKKSEPIDAITDDIRTLVQDMKETMDSFNAIGLAAPQVHRSIRLFIIRDPVRDPEGVNGPHGIKVFINPELSLFSNSLCVLSEGCLSIPGIRSDVERPEEITVEYTNLEGNRTKERFSGWDARVILHENDHIDGVLFIDRLIEEERKHFEPFLEDLQRRVSQS